VTEVTREEADLDQATDIKNTEEEAQAQAEADKFELFHFYF
jgi:hypothetical protein